MDVKGITEAWHSTDSAKDISTKYGCTMSQLYKYWNRARNVGELPRGVPRVVDKAYGEPDLTTDRRQGDPLLLKLHASPEGKQFLERQQRRVG